MTDDPAAAGADITRGRKTGSMPGGEKGKRPPKRAPCARARVRAVRMLKKRRYWRSWSQRSSAPHSHAPVPRRVCAALLCLTAVLPVMPDHFFQVDFGFANAAVRIVVHNRYKRFKTDQDRRVCKYEKTRIESRISKIDRSEVAVELGNPHMFAEILNV
jgi:hypothetical protein